MMSGLYFHIVRIENGTAFHTQSRFRYHHVTLSGKATLTLPCTYGDNAPMENFFGHLKEEYLRQFKKTNFLRSTTID